MNLYARPLSALMTTLLVLALAGCGKSPEEHMQAGSAFLDKKDYKAAILELKTVLQEQPGNRDARLLLGKAYLASDAYVDAEKELVKAREQGSSNDEVMPALAKALLKQNQVQKLLDLKLPTNVMSGKALASVHVIRAEALLGQNKKEEARSALMQAEQAESMLPELLLLKARMAGEQHNFTEAYQLVDAALAGNPQLVDGHYYKAALFDADGKPQQAMQSYQNALKIDPKDYRSLLAISDIQLRAGEKEAGVKTLQAAEVAAPNMPLVKYARGLYELRENNFKAANDALLQFLRVAPDYLPAQLASAMANLGLGNNEQSLKLAQLVLAKQPNNVLAARVLAASQIKSGDPKEALATLAPFLKDHTNDAQLLALAGEANYQSKDFNQAASLLRQAEVLAPGNADIKNRQAESLLELGKPEQALAELEQSANLSDKASRADMALVSVNLKRRDYDKALQAIAALEKKLPDRAVTHNLRAVALLGKKDHSGARKALEKAIALDAKFFPAVLNLARLDLMDKKPEAAKLRFEGLLVKDPDNLQSMLALADLALFNKQEKDYVNWLQKAADAHPKALQPRALLTRFYLAKKENSLALAAANAALKNNPDDLQAMHLLGSTQMATQDTKAGIETYRALVQNVPNSAEANFLLGTALAMAKNSEEARISLNKALKIKSDFLEAMFAMLNLERVEKHPEAALQWAKKIQSVRPAAPDGYASEGDIQMTQRQFLLAVKAYQTALDFGAGTREFLKLHNALIQSGDAKTAQAKIEAWIKKKPNDLIVRSHYAGQAFKAGQTKNAIAQYEEIFRQSPENAMVMNNLAVLYQQVKDARALGLAEKSYQSLPKNPIVQDTLGWILLEQGELKRGLELLSQAAELAEKNPTIQYHYAVGLVREGNKAKAKQVLQPVLSGLGEFSERALAKILMESL